MKANEPSPPGPCNPQCSSAMIAPQPTALLPPFDKPLVPQVSTGLRWLDLIRHDSSAIVGTVNVAIVFELLAEAPPSPPEPHGNWLTVNGTSAAQCQEGHVLTDCVCMCERTGYDGHLAEKRGGDWLAGGSTLAKLRLLGRSTRILLYSDPAASP